MKPQPELIAAAAEIVAAFVTRNPIGAEQLPGLIHQTIAALATTGRTQQPQAEAPSSPPEPAVPIKNSVSRERITCLEDGKQFKSLKRHLRTDHDLTPDQYRSRWELAKDYPMSAPAYSEQRSSLARQMGLGHAGKAQAK